MQGNLHLPERCIEVYSEPAPSSFARVQRYKASQANSLSSFPDVSVAVSAVLPPA